MGLSTALAVGGSLLSARNSRRASRRAAGAQEDAQREAIAEQRRSKEEALGFYAPYSDTAGLGLDLAPFLTDAQAQYDWLQSNPLFQMSLDNANDVTSKMAAAQGRLSSGDTLMQLQNNALLASQPLLNRQMGNINNLINLGAGLTNAQANAALGVGNNISGYMSNIGDAQAAGIIDAANATNQGLGALTSGLMSAFPGANIIGGR